MKKIISFVFAAAFSAGLFAGQGMLITQTYAGATNKGASVSVTWYVTASQCKMKMVYADGKMNTTTFFIPDPANGKLLTYSDGTAPGAPQKVFYTIPVSGIKEDHEDVMQATVTKTGETKTIGGMVCEKITAKTARGTTEMWVTKDFKPDMYKFFPYFQGSIELKVLSQEGIQGVPLESVTKDNTGALIESYTFVSAVNTELNTGDFSVPAEYKEAGGGNK